MPYILFGNESILHTVKTPVWDSDGITLLEEKSVVEHLEGRSITTYGPPAEWDLFRILEAFTTPVVGAWAAHSDQPPTWVECPGDPVLAEMFARHYGCPVGRPDGWEISPYLRSHLHSDLTILEPDPFEGVTP